MSKFNGVIGEKLESRRLLAAVAWDGGGDGVLWTDPANWSTDSLPTAADDVTIDVAGDLTVQLTGGEQTIASLTSAETVSIATASLRVTNPSTTAGLILLPNGLVGGDELAVTERFDWSGGTIDGDFTLRLGPSSTAIFHNNSLDGKNLLGTLINEGQLTIDPESTPVTFGDGADFNGNFINDATGQLRFAALAEEDFYIFYNSDNDNLDTFINRGSIVVDQADLDVIIRVPVTNEGEIRVEAGALRFQRNSTTTTPIVVEAGGDFQVLRLEFLTGDAGVEGSGELRLSGAITLDNERLDPNLTLRLAAGDITVSQPVEFAGIIQNGSAYIRNSSTLTVTETFNFGRLRMTGNDGKLIIAETASGIFNGGNFDGTIINYGTVEQWDFLRFGLNINTDAIFINETTGVHRFTRDTTFDVNVDANTKYYYNRGLLQRTDQLSTSTFEVDFRNEGDVVVNGGTLTFNGETNLDADFPGFSGTYLVQPGGRLNLPGDLTTLSADLTLEGGGVIAGLGDLDVIRGDLKLTGGADLFLAPASGTLTLEGGLFLSVNSYVSVSGNLKLAGTFGPTLSIGLAGVDVFGRLVVSGTVALDTPDTDSTLVLDLQTDPVFPDLAIGDTFVFLTTGGGITGNFDDYVGGGVYSNALILTRPDDRTMAFEVAEAPERGPQILRRTFEQDTELSFSITFDQDVGLLLNPDDFYLFDLDTNERVPTSRFGVRYDPSTFTATLVMTGELPNGNYRVYALNSDFQNAAGISRPVGSGGAFFDFFVLAGDANRDRVVDLADFVILRNNFGTGETTFSQGDFDYDGTVDLADFVILRNNFGQTVPEPGDDEEGGGLFS